MIFKHFQIFSEETKRTVTSIAAPNASMTLTVTVTATALCSPALRDRPPHPAITYTLLLRHIGEDDDIYLNQCISFNKRK